MRTLSVSALLLGGVLSLAAAPASPPATRGECAPEHAGLTLCLYRSLLPSAGIVTSCRDRHDCRVGPYYGSPSDAVWLRPPPGMAAFPEPEVIWFTSTLAQVRVECGLGCSWSYFYEVTRHRLSEPRRSVLAVDPRRLLAAMADGRSLTVRQVFTGHEVARIERNWAPGAWLGESITMLRFDPDGRLSLTWLRGAERTPVSERLSIPSIPRS